MGYSLNQLSIAGFVVALGLLVDDSIVAVENIARHVRMGYSRTDAAIAGEMAEDSRREQAGAGLDRLTAAEFARFGELNTAYVARFGFPFIYAVKGANKLDILAAFADRLANAPATEFATALAQISRIFRFRIEDRVRL